MKAQHRTTSALNLLLLFGLAAACSTTPSPPEPGAEPVEAQDAATAGPDAAGEEDEKM